MFCGRFFCEDAAAYVAPRKYLQGVKVFNAVDLEGLFILGTVVLDYRGYRVTAQSIIPGILEREMKEDEAKRIVEITSGEKKDVEDCTKQIVKKAALAVGSLKETEFDIRFNPDVFSPGVIHPKDITRQFNKGRQLVQVGLDFGHF
jgi:hypothetical protein